MPPSLPCTHFVAPSVFFVLISSILSFILNPIYFPTCSPLLCYFCSLIYRFFTLCLSQNYTLLSICLTHSSQQPFLNSCVRSDPFRQPEKANYLPFYDFQYFTSVLLQSCWLSALTHACTHTSVHTPTKAINNSHAMLTTYTYPYANLHPWGYIMLG